ncbi:MAG: aminotransferase class I/II-fold pyridoxal phosphate-dependent enzyme [Spirochaetia bacterium]
MSLRPFLLERYFARYEFETPYLLCASDCESMSIDELLGSEPGARERCMAVRLGYTDSRGAPSLRKEICKLYGSISPEQVLVHSGAEEAIFLFMHAALASGDHVIVHQPCYQSLHEVARSIGCEVSAWQAREENKWSLDPNELRSLVRPRTRAIVLNSPHNPTGFHMKRSVFEETLRFAHERGIVVFSDEVYRGLEYEESERLPAACDLSERALSLGVMSKTYGLAGLRIGWIGTRNTAILERMAELKDYTTICCGAASEFLAEVALRHGDAIAERNRRIVLFNLGLLDGFFSRHADRFSWRPPAAGPVAFPRLLHGDVAEFCQSAASSSGVLLLPGTVFGDHGNHFRIGFGRMSMPPALQKLEEHLRQHRAGT